MTVKESYYLPNSNLKSSFSCQFKNLIKGDSYSKKFNPKTDSMQIGMIINTTKIKE